MREKRPTALITAVLAVLAVMSACGGTASRPASAARPKPSPSPSHTPGTGHRAQLELHTYRVGDCVRWADGAGVAAGSKPTIVACTKPHFLEIAGQAAVGPEVTEYPSSDQWGPLIAKVCDPVVANYLGGALDPRGIFSAYAVHPRQTLWDLGVHTLDCAVEKRAQRQAERDQIATITGTARGVSQSTTWPVGSCIALTASNSFDLPGDCSQPHVVEVTGVADISEQIDHLPAPHELDRFLVPTCGLLATQYIGHSLDGDLIAAWLTFDARSWAAGRRKLECLVAHGAVGAFRPVSGSIATGA